MKRVLVIEFCNECPNFDDEYYSYNEECDKLDRVIKKDKDGNRAIPEDCPLEKEKK